jgi:hypothetical protein
MDYVVRAFALTADEVKDLRLILGTNATTVGLVTEPDDAYNALSLVWVPVEFGLKHSGSVLLPIAGAIGKSALDLPVDRVKEWLATRPGNRRVEIYGPDNQVVRIVKNGEEIRTSSVEFSKDPRR